MPVRNTLVFSFVLIFILQVLCLGNFWWAVRWPYENPLSFLFNWFFVSALSLLLQSFFGQRRMAAVILAGTIVLFGVLGAFKIGMLGMPLLPWDFFVAKEAVETLAVSPKLLTQAMLGLFATCLLLAVFVKFLPANKIRLSIRQRLLWGFLSVFWLAIFLLKNNPIHDRLFSQNFVLHNNKPIENIQRNGMLISFILYLEKGNLYPPSDFSEDKAKQALEKYTLTSARKTASARISPDIVVVMSESLFDPQELKGVKWKRDPLEYTRSLSKNSKLSLAVVPTYGGKTANSEFEFLTGHAVRFLARGVVPYNQILEGNQLSIVQTLKQYGYRATAVHPGDRNFFNRDVVYKNFGFDEFKANDSFVNAPTIGNYTTDDSILQVLKNSLEEHDQPSFHFIVTIQNHMPYEGGPFDLSHALFSPEGLSKEEQVVLNHYSQLVEVSDRFHHHLVEYLSTRQRPTLLLIFGDHLPALLPNYRIFSEHLVSSTDSRKWTQDEWRQMYTTPLITWSNFGFKEEKEPLEVSFLGVRTLDQLGFELHPYQKFLVDFSQHLRVVNPNLEVKKEGEIANYWSTYKILQYGVLTGLFDGVRASVYK